MEKEKNKKQADLIDDDVNDQVAYTWEEEYKRSWDALQEDENGSLQSAVASFHNRMKRKRDRGETVPIQRGLIRYTYIVVDCSINTTEKDLRPSRLELIFQTLEAFIMEYFDQNPLSQIGIIITRDGLAEKISELGSNPLDHIRAIKNKKNRDSSGTISLQNALQLATSSLTRTPIHGSREILCLLGSLTSTDPGDIEQTIEQLVQKTVRVSIIELVAEVFMFKKICELTNGTFSVAINEGHFRDLVFGCIPPPPTSASSNNSGFAEGNELVVMGFATRINDECPTFCLCHHKLSVSGYQCPRCKCKVCSLPTICGVCGLSLIASPHLSRSYHHLFPIKPFVVAKPNSSNNKEDDDGGDDDEQKLDDGDNNKPCFGCSMDLVLGQEVYKCSDCHNVYCLECDIFVHDVLHNCPGCV